MDASNGKSDVKFPFCWGVASDVGKVREQNEDAFAVELEAGLFLVADGMGGHRGGELASQIIAQDLPPAVETGLGKLKSRRVASIRSLLGRHVARQNRHLHMESRSESGYEGMGATLVLALLLDGRAYVANVGDSRAYRFRNGRLLQLSKDHSVVAELVEAGHITPAQAQSHADLGVITQHIGMPERTRPCVRSFALKPADRLLLCTDGLTDMVPDAMITQVLAEQSDCQQCCDRLVDLANKVGGQDNITVLIVQWLS